MKNHLPIFNECPLLQVQFEEKSHSYVKSKLQYATLPFFNEKLGKYEFYQKHTIIEGKKVRKVPSSQKSALYYRHNLRENSIFWVFKIKYILQQTTKKSEKCPLLQVQFEEKSHSYVKSKLHYNTGTLTITLALCPFSIKKLEKYEFYQKHTIIEGTKISKRLSIIGAI